MINVGLFLPHATNNIVEYAAVIGSLTNALTFQPSHIDLFTDSMLVVNRLNQVWKVAHPTLQAYTATVRSLMATFPDIHLQHVPREFNIDANCLVNSILQHFLSS